VALGVVAVLVLIRAVSDIRAKRYIWGALGFAAALTLLSAPMAEYSVTFTLPAEREH
jgi:hypothetical protein